jgi:energy-coupling factor transporter ATP-binding protein EcfA2
VNNSGHAAPDAASGVTPIPAASAITSPDKTPSQPVSSGTIVSLTGTMVGTSTIQASISLKPYIQIARITVSDFRGFPPGEPYRFQFENRKNLLLHGENGAGKTSLFQALRLLLSPQKPRKTFTDFQHLFAKRDATMAGVIAIDLTAGTPGDYRWDAGNPHPSEDKKDTSFREFARRATFLDYKALLQTSFLHEEKDHINLFDLLVDKLLQGAEFPDGKTVTESWREVRYYFGSTRRRRARKDARREHINGLAKVFRDQLNDLLNAEKVGVVAKTNQILEKLSSALSPFPNLQSPNKDAFAITLEVGIPKLSTADMRRTRPPHEFVGTEVTLQATFGGKPIPHPAIFFNEARLTAIALALYLGTALTTIPKAKTSNLCPLLVLDDALIGLDLAHRLPLLDLLNGDEFKDWQILLLTYDANWFDMASDHLPDALWTKHRLHAKAHEAGWEVPVLEADSPYLDRAWNHIQSGDFKAAGVYLRTAWETVMRTFCENRQLKVPLKRQMHEYKAEDFWPLVRNFDFKPKHRLVDAALAEEIEICRRYVLNPLCHNDPARPSREEVRRAHSAVSRLKILLEQETSWLKHLDSELRAATVHIIGDNEKLRERALKGLALPDDLALHCACRLLASGAPPLPEIAGLLRSSFDRAIWSFSDRKAFSFPLKCSDTLTTHQLWQHAADAPNGLKVAQPAFVAGIEAHRDFMIEDSPTRDVLAAKTQADLEQIRNLLCGGVPAAKPKSVIDAW